MKWLVKFHKNVNYETKENSLLLPFRNLYT